MPTIVCMQIFALICWQQDSNVVFVLFIKNEEKRGSLFMKFGLDSEFPHNIALNSKSFNRTEWTFLNNHTLFWFFYLNFNSSYLRQLCEPTTQWNIVWAPVYLSNFDWPINLKWFFLSCALFIQSLDADTIRNCWLNFMNAKTWQITFYYTSVTISWIFCNRYAFYNMLAA